MRKIEIGWQESAPSVWRNFAPVESDRDAKFGENSMLERFTDAPLVSVQSSPSILVVNAALSLHESHVQFIRAIPAIVEIVPSCADLYSHSKRGYALVILALDREAGETTDAANFARQQWSTAKILLIEAERATIDDWLYDERVEPDCTAEAICDAAKRLLVTRPQS